jgi:hypothetical protein
VKLSDLSGEILGMTDIDEINDFSVGGIQGRNPIMIPFPRAFKGPFGIA